MSMATGSRKSSMTGDKLPKGYEAGQIQKFTPEQMELYRRSFAQAGPDSYLSKLAGGDQAAYDQLEAPALRQFQGLQGNIASRFSGGGGGPGSLSSRRSSGFQNTVNQASSDFAQQLQSQRMGIQRQAMQDLRGLTSDLLSYEPYERFAIQKQQKTPWWKTAINGGLTAAGGVVGGIYGGPMGAAAGAQFGNQIGSAFTGGSGQADYSGIGNLPSKWKF